MAAIQEVITANTVGSIEPNCLSEIQRRQPMEKLGWGAPLTVLVGRSAFAVVAQAVVALTLLAGRSSFSWRASVSWWTIYGTLVDIGCLVLMRHFCRREGIRLRDLIGKVNLHRGHDIIRGAAYLLLVFPFFYFGALLASKVVYGGIPNLYPGSLTERALPLWAVIYSLSAWWIIWSPTEEMTYQGYVLPRLRALSGRWPTAIVLTSFLWALQHSFFPLIPEWHYIAWRFLAFLPGCIVFTLIYARTQRLAPLILAHWAMDIVGTTITLKF